VKLVLVIEENPELRENTAEFLELSGFRVLTANNGQDALLLLRHSRPDVILCDLLLPRCGGLTFLNEIKRDKNSSHIPLVLFSAGPVPRTLHREAAHSDFFLAKPFTNEELLEAVDHSLAAGKTEGKGI
jgi:CRP/FNR family transcriptional regulator, polysaccharide utilization system transcription regulator